MFDLKRPCKTCPFTDPHTLYLSPARKEEIAASLQSGAQFICHNTFEWDEDDEGESYPAYDQHSQFCAGALIMLEKEGEDHQLTQVARRLGLYEPGVLDITLVPFGSFEEWIEVED